MNEEDERRVESIDQECTYILHNLSPSMSREELEVFAMSLVQSIKEANQIMANQRRQLDRYTEIVLSLIRLTRDVKRTPSILDGRLLRRLAKIEAQMVGASKEES